MFKLNFRIISHSFVFILYFFFILAVFLLLVFSAILDSQINYINFTICLRDMSYLGVAVLIVSFCMAVYFAQRDWALEMVAMISALRAYLTRYFVLLLLSHIILIPLLIYVVIMSELQQTEFLYSFSAFAVTGLRWSTTILIGESLGYLSGILCKQVYVHLLAIPCVCVFSMLNSYLFSVFSSGSDSFANKLAGLLSTQEPFPSGMPLDFTGLQLDRFFLSGMLFKLLLTIILTLLIAFAVTRIQRPRCMYFLHINACTLAGSVLLLILSVCFYSASYPTTYNTWEKLYAPIQENQAASITSVSGRIELASTYKANCSVLFEVSASDSLSFRLDSSFSDLTVSYDGTQLSYERSGDTVTVYLEEEPIGSVTLDMVYSGYLYYLSDTNNVDVFSSASAAALPAGFAFLPYADDGEAVSYDLTVRSRNTVISKLDTVSLGENCYAVSGTDTSICLFSGYLKEIQLEGKTCYCTKYNVRTDYAALYQQLDSMSAYLDAAEIRKAQQMDILEVAPSEPSKLFFIYYFYGTGGFPIFCGNSVFMNYGYAT